MTAHVFVLEAVGGDEGEQEEKVPPKFPNTRTSTRLGQEGADMKIATATATTSAIKGTTTDPCF